MSGKDSLIGDEKTEEYVRPRSITNPPNFISGTNPYPSITKFSLKSEKDIRSLETAFNTFGKILATRKEDCMRFANESVNNYKKQKGGKKGQSKRNKDGSGIHIKFESIIMDVDNNKSELTKLATKRAQLEYSLMIEEKACITKTREYMYYEDFNKGAKKELIEWQELVNAAADDLQAEKENYKQQLQTVLPALADANKKLKAIKKEQLVEFKSLKQPARVIISVVKCVAMMLGDITILNEKHYREWKDVKKLISQEMIEKMRTFDFDIKDEKSIQNRDNIDTNWVKKKNITYEKAKQSNGTAGILMLWLIKTIELTRLRQEVAPLEIKIDELSQVRGLKDREVKRLQELIEDNEKHMQRVHKEMKTLVNKINAIRDEITTEIEGCDGQDEQKE